MYPVYQVPYHGGIFTKPIDIKKEIILYDAIRINDQIAICNGKIWNEKIFNF